MTDKEFLQWLYNRLEHVYGNNPCTDYMLRLKRIIDSLEKNFCCKSKTQEV